MGGTIKEGVLTANADEDEVTYIYDCGGGKTIVCTIQFCITVNEANFPDEVFRTYVSDSFDTDADGILTTEEIAAAKRIDLFTEGIITVTDLTGVEYFTALEYLNCCNNDLTSLDVSGNTALTHLNCCRNQLTSLDVSKNTALTELYCNNNQLTSLDVSQNTMLEYLNCSNNQLTSLDVSQNTALEYLDCSYNQLTSLDVSKNAALTGLHCYKNQLESLDVRQNTKLTDLDCSYNQLTSLDVSQNTALETLGCENTPLLALNGVSEKLLYCSAGSLATAVLLTASVTLKDYGIVEKNISNLTGGAITDGVVLTPDADKVTYTYDCG
ncbi:MAG: hypothetical protein E7511_08540, partial [Ruminococcus sp.]|nr:hypothetical protein [Ruminococcus sp.]